MTEQLTNGYDYGISRVRYDSAHSHIESAIVHKVDGQGICCEGCEWRRLDVVRRLKEQDSFVTLPRREGGGVRFGQKVKIWDKRFIRSIPNGKESDNLAHLPRIVSSYGISKVRYSSGHSNIDRVLVHKVERHVDPKIRDARIRRDGITICCDGCVWRRDDVVDRIIEGDSFVTLRKVKTDPAVKVWRHKFIRSIADRRADDNLEALE